MADMIVEAIIHSVYRLTGKKDNEQIGLITILSAQSEDDHTDEVLDRIVAIKTDMEEKAAATKAELTQIKTDINEKTTSIMDKIETDNEKVTNEMIAIKTSMDKIESDNKKVLDLLVKLSPSPQQEEEE